MNDQTLRQPCSESLALIDRYFQCHGTIQERKGWNIEMECYMPKDCTTWSEVQRNNPRLFDAAWAKAKEWMRNRRVTGAIILYFNHKQ